MIRYRILRSTISVLSLLLGLVLSSAGAFAQGMPNEAEQEALIKATLLALNEANNTGNWAAFHAKTSRTTQDQFSVHEMRAKLAGTAGLAGLDVSEIAATKPVVTDQAKIDDEGLLILTGRFDFKSSTVIYKFGFLPSDGTWKPAGMSVGYEKK